jgi:L-asparagine transporter-like permease
VPDWDFSIYNYLALFLAGLVVLLVSLLVRSKKIKLLLFRCSWIFILISLFFLIRWKIKFDKREEKREKNLEKIAFVNGNKFAIA